MKTRPFKTGAEFEFVILGSRAAVGKRAASFARRDSRGRLSPHRLGLAHSGTTAVSKPLFQMCRLPAQQGPSEAGWAAAAVDAEFAARESAEIESGLAEAGVGVAIFFDGEETVVTKRQDIAGESVALSGIDFDEGAFARLQKFDGLDSEPGQIDKSGVIVEQTNQRHEVQTCRGSWAVGQRRGKNLDFFR